MHEVIFAAVAAGNSNFDGLHTPKTLQSVQHGGVVRAKNGDGGGSGGTNVSLIREHGGRAAPTKLVERLRLVDGTNVAAAVRLLLELHAAHVGAHLGGAVAAARALALGALKRAAVEMHHGDVAVESVKEGKLAVAGNTLMLALLQVHRPVDGREESKRKRVGREDG